LVRIFFINTMAAPKKYKTECPECGSRNIIYNPKTKKTICKDCGAIFRELTPKKEEKFEKVRRA